MRFWPLVDKKSRIGGGSRRGHRALEAVSAKGDGCAAKPGAKGLQCTIWGPSRALEAFSARKVAHRGRFAPRGGQITHLARFRSKESRARCPSRHTAPLPPAPFRLKAIEGALNRFQAQRGVTLGPQVGRGPQPAYRPQPARRPPPHAKGEAAAAASPAQPHDPRALRPRRRWSLSPTRRAFRWRCKSRRKARRWRTTPAQRQPPPAEPPR